MKQAEERKEAAEVVSSAGSGGMDQQAVRDEEGRATTPTPEGKNAKM